MRIEKVIDINDEPFSSEVTGKRQVKIIYNGPRYIYLEIDELSRVQAVMHISENAPDEKTAMQKLSMIAGRQLCEVDAEKTLIAACHFWNSYTLEIDEYSETLSNGETYTHTYGGQPNVYDVWDFNQMTWNAAKKDFDIYKFIESPVSQQVMIESCDILISKVQQAVVENGSLTAEEKSLLNDYVIQINQFKAKVHSGIKHYKLVFPACNIPY